MFSRVLAAAVFSALAAVVAFGQTTSADEDLVVQFYPSQFNPLADKLYDFARADLDGTGKSDYIVAVYCGNPPGIVRVLRANGGGASLVAEAAPETMGGHFPRLRLVDLDGDGRPEIAASFATMGAAEETWIFKWSSSRLTAFGPTFTTGRQNLMHSLIGLVEFFDVDGDGVADIVESDRVGEDRRVWKRLPDGSYKIAHNQLLYVNRFERHTGEPELFTGLFAATEGQQLVVTVVNGDRIAEHAVTAAELFVNGKQIFGPSDFKKSGRLLTATIAAAETNEVEASLEGKPGTAITVTIAPAK